MNTAPPYSVGTCSSPVVIRTMPRTMPSIRDTKTRAGCRARIILLLTMPATWVATDGQPATIKHNDAVYVVEVEGPQRGVAKMFMSGLPGGEVCGPAFTPDHRTFFLAVQHPGEGKGATFANPLSRFPDYKPICPAQRAKCGSDLSASMAARSEVKEPERWWGTGMPSPPPMPRAEMFGVGGCIDQASECCRD